MTDTPSIETQVTEQVERFMRNLLDAGMALDKVVEHGFVCAQESYGHSVYMSEDRRPFAFEAMREASDILLKVARKLQIDRQSAQAQWEAHSTKEAEQA